MKNELNNIGIGDSLTIELHHGGPLTVCSPEDSSVPQDVLGVYWTPSREQAEAHGVVTTQTHELQSVFPVNAGDVPRSVEEVLQWKSDLLADGYDAVVIRSVGGDDLPEVVAL